MQITLTLNGIKVTEDVAADMLLIDFVRAHGCKSVKRGCETSNCALVSDEGTEFGAFCLQAFQRGDLMTAGPGRQH